VSTAESWIVEVVSPLFIQREVEFANSVLAKEVAFGLSRRIRLSEPVSEEKGDDKR